MNWIPSRANSTASASSYIDSRKPGPNSRCTRIAAAITCSVISECLRILPTFLLSSFILLDYRVSTGFFPAGIVGEGTGWNLFALGQFLRGAFRWKRRWKGFASVSGKFLWKFFDETLGRPGTSLAEGANSSPGDIVANCLKSRRIFRNSAAVQHALSNFFHPKRTFPARRALPARFVGIKF